MRKVPHECQCDNTYEVFDLIIDGDSVKVGPKIFNRDEIVRLRTLNGMNNETTYSIFEAIDSVTLKCEDIK